MTQTSVGPLAWVNGSDAPEKSAINLGFMALSDCASVVVAATQGFAQPYGLTLNLKRQSSWATCGTIWSAVNSMPPITDCP